MMKRQYRAIVSSDWNGCLSPSSPYDPISFVYPKLTSELTIIFHKYTTGETSLGEANKKIQKILPAPISVEQMDTYLDKSFTTYKGVPDFISWCLSQNILFMINTTGAIGYFQRVFAKGLLPKIPMLSANPLIRYPRSNTDPGSIYKLLEIQDKATNTNKIMQLSGIPAKKIFLIGDSGGDGPHFKWGTDQGSYLIGSMAKSSLMLYCEKNGIKINLLFGISPVKEDKAKPVKEGSVDFMELSRFIEEKLSNISLEA